MSKLELLTKTSDNLFVMEMKENEIFCKNVLQFAVKFNIKFDEEFFYFQIPDYQGGKNSLKEVNVRTDYFLLEMYEKSKLGYNFLTEMHIVPFFDSRFNEYRLTTIISYKKIADEITNLGYRIEFPKIYKGDTFTEIGELLHDWQIVQKKDFVERINEQGQLINNVQFYGAAIFKGDVQIGSYFESKDNIRNRANFKNKFMVNSPNSAHQMHYKFVLLRLIELLKVKGLLKDVVNYAEVENYGSYVELPAYNETKPLSATAQKNVENLKKMEEVATEATKKTVEAKNDTVNTGFVFDEVENTSEVDPDNPFA